MRTSHTGPAVQLVPPGLLSPECALITALLYSSSLNTLAALILLGLPRLRASHLPDVGGIIPIQNSSPQFLSYPCPLPVLKTHSGRPYLRV